MLYRSKKSRLSHNNIKAQKHLKSSAFIGDYPEPCCQGQIHLVHFMLLREQKSMTDKTSTKFNKKIPLY